MIRENSFVPVYTDIHIHTSEDPDKLNSKYNIEKLIANMNKIAQNSIKLISFTDHNVINKSVYLSEFPNDVYLVLGVELHIRFAKEKEPYHCHMLFDCEITENTIDVINDKLNKYYPIKHIKNEDNIPFLQDIINEFDDYNYLILPHGGQNHKTFNLAIPKGSKLNNVMERMLYYNQFDGFTSRSQTGTKKTIDYFKKLGINEFTNLLTCSDNYKPNSYPNPKSGTKTFIPTWILSEPTFEGLKIALSEKSRLIYSKEKPEIYEEYIKEYKIKNDKLNIDVKFQPGLNVIIGESSSGKSLLVDTLLNSIKGTIKQSSYAKKFDFANLNVSNPAGFTPHYINQNYIMDISKTEKIEDIPLIKKMFGSKTEIEIKTDEKILELKETLDFIIDKVESIQQLHSEFKSLLSINKILLKKTKNINPFNTIFPDNRLLEKMDFSKTTYNEFLTKLDEIDKFAKNNIFTDDITNEIEIIKEKLKNSFELNVFQEIISNIISDKQTKFLEMLEQQTDKEKIKKENYNKLIYFISKYLEEIDAFDKKIKKLKKYSYKINSDKKVIANHKLYVSNEFKIDDKVILENLNTFLIRDKEIKEFDSITPEMLFLNNYNGNYKIKSYDILKNKLLEAFTSNNVYKYKITTSDNRNWSDLSPGWKTAILTELILQYDGDQAPLIIDQPEDNLANGYINNKLITDIQKAKIRKQIIIVTHNATIPVLGDAQNIIVCQTKNNVLNINSGLLEEKIDDKFSLEHIAQIADGGKSSIKKRFKKYNIKKFRESD